MRWVAVLAVGGFIAGCSGDDGAATEAVDTSRGGDIDLSTDAADDSTGPPDTAPDTSPDTASSLDTSTAGVDDTQADTTPPEVADATGGGGLCTVGETRCEGYLLLRCDSAADGFTLASTCELGCVDGQPASVCASSCTAGVDLGCVTGTARRCAVDGVSAYAVACNGGCDVQQRGCEPLGADERALVSTTGESAAVGVGDVAVAPDGNLLFAWREPGAFVVKVMMTDPDGNALTAGTVLPQSLTEGFTQLQVRAAASGDFAVMGLAPGDAPRASVTVWRVQRALGHHRFELSKLADQESLEAPSLLAFDDLTAVYHLVGGATAADRQVARRSWDLSASPVTLTVDPVESQRYDVLAVRASADTAHVYTASAGGARVTVSSLAEPAGTTISLNTGELLFAAGHGLGGSSIMSAFDFAPATEVAGFQRFDGAAAGAFVTLQDADWLQVALTGSGVVVATQQSEGTLRIGAGDGSAAPQLATIYTPTGGGAREDFWLAYDASAGVTRLVTLGRDSAVSPVGLRISKPPL